MITYIRATSELSLTLELSNVLEILANIDASFGVHFDYKSHTGVAILKGLGLELGWSTKQRLNTKSRTEAELMGVSDGLNTILWLRNFLIAQGYKIGPVKLFQENISTIKIIKNGKSSSEYRIYNPLSYSIWI